MTTTTCLHPNCPTAMERGRLCCGKHFYALPDDLQRRLRAVLRSDLSSKGALRIEITEYFDSRLIGDHEVVDCKYCHKPIVFLVTKAGYAIPVNADGVEPDDDQIDINKHKRHRDHCPNFGITK